MMVKVRIIAAGVSSLLLAAFLASGINYQRQSTSGAMHRPLTSGSMTAESVPKVPDLTVPDTTDDGYDDIDIGGFESGAVDTDNPPVTVTEETERPETSGEITTEAPVVTPPAVTTEKPVDPPVIPEGQGGLINIKNPNYNYQRQVVILTPDDRDLLERLVEGEAGDQGYIGAALVAQCIKDAMTYQGFRSVAEVRTGMKYSGSIKREPCEDVLRAVSYVFDEGGYAVRHPILYFYYSRNGIRPDVFHETQEFVIEYRDHRFFWKKGS